MSAIAERFDGSQLRRPRNVQVQRHHHPRYSKASLRWSCRVSCAKHTQHTSSSHAYTLRVVSCAEFLCAELQRFKLNDIEFYLPQFCNLLLTRQQYPQAIEEYTHTHHRTRSLSLSLSPSRLCVRVRVRWCCRAVSCGCEQVAHRAVPQLAAPGPAHLLHHPGGRRGLHPRNPQTSTPPRTKTHGTRPRPQLRFVCRVVSCRVCCVVSCRVVCCVVGRVVSCEPLVVIDVMLCDVVEGIRWTTG